MKIAIENIKVDENMRIRKEIGDLQQLEDSIQKVGLLNPIVIDENGELIAGYRRLFACKNLGMAEIEVTVVDVAGDKLGKLEVELAENYFRKDFTPEEILASEERRREILESMREKTAWERCKLWFKNLFTSPPPDEPQKESNKDSAINPEQLNTKETMSTESARADVETEMSEKSQEPEIQKAESTNPPIREKDSAVNDQHAIKWRTS